MAEETSLQVRAAVRGEAEARGWIVRRFSGMLRLKVELRLPAAVRRVIDADDVVQNVWAAVLPRLHEFVPLGARYTPAFLRYLNVAAMRILQRTADVELRRLERAGGGDDGGDAVESAPASALSDPALAVATREAWAELAAALGALSQDDRELLALRAVEGRSFVELGPRFGASAGALRKRYERALELLRSILPPSALQELRDDDVDAAAAED